MARRYKKAHKKGFKKRQNNFRVISGERIIIDHIGMAGDGVGEYDGEAIYVPFTMAGEKVNVDVVGKSRHGYKGVLKGVVSPSDDRKEPICQHFENCGGCKLQHLQQADYASFKMDNFKESMARRGFDIDELSIKELWHVDLAARRRARFGAKKTKKYLVLGYRGLGQHGLFDIKTCPILDDKILAILPSLREFLFEALEEAAEIDIHITNYPEGLDIVLILPRDTEASVDLLMEGAIFAEKNDIARLSWQDGEDGEVTPMGIRRDPALSYDNLGVRGTKILMPAGGFLQASAKAEQKMQNIIIGAFDDNNKKEDYKIADLFCGWGSLSLPLLKHGCKEIIAVDNAGEAIDSLTKGVSYAGLGGRLKPDCRDLFKEALEGNELDGLDAVIFDPPRAGAKAQAEALAVSDIPLIIGVSCNQQSFARDARILENGGYEMKEIHLIDQFLYAAHLEIIAVFCKSND